MEQTLLYLGIVCVVAAIVGGGFKGLGIEVPLIATVRRQLLLATAGVALMAGAGAVHYINRPRVDADAELTAGLERYDAGDYFGALGHLQAAARAGQPQAQYHYGEMLYHGEGINPDQQAGLAWVRRSAESGFALAQSSLAMDYLKSQETKGEARQWAERSAKQGDATGLYILVITDTDPKVQLEHLRAAASKGLPQAQRDMARMLFTQTMKTSDSKIKGGLVLEAFSWSLKGALQGEPSSMCLAASALNAISRIPPEAEWAVEKAYMWTLKCIEHGSEARKVLGEGLPGEETRQDLYKRLSFEAVERANKEAAEWKPAPAGVVRHGHFETPASARTER